MNRINPLYIALLLIVVLIISIAKLNGAKNELREEKVKFSETMTLANDLSTLKSVYSSKNASKSAILKILKHSSLKSENIIKDVKAKSIVIDAKSINIKVLNYLLGKLLNGAYNIVSLDVKKLSDTKVSLHVEIKW